MKKILIVIVMFIILISNGQAETQFTLLDYFDGEYYSYTNEPVSDNYINLGTCYMNFTSDKVENLIGESMLIENFEPSSAIKQLNAKVIKTEFLEDGTTVIYAYSNKIKRSVEIDNTEVNLQIAYYEEYSVIGWPLILGSF